MYFPYTIIDLSHILDDVVPSWDNSPGFQNETVLDYHECLTGVPFKVQHISCHAGIGTHIDAPAHTSKNGLTVDSMPLQGLIVPCVVIDTSARCHQDYKVSLHDVEMFEAAHGPLQAGSCVFFYTGWGRYWNDRDTYHNNHQFPTLSPKVVDYLVERKIAGIGIDTLGPDRPQDHFYAHEKLLGAGIYIIENITNLSQLPVVGAFSCALPLPIKNGTESPLRLIAFVPK